MKLRQKDLKRKTLRFDGRNDWSSVFDVVCFAPGYGGRYGVVTNHAYQRSGPTFTIEHLQTALDAGRLEILDDCASDLLAKS